LPEKTDLRSLTWEDLAGLVRDLGVENYRAGQIAQWVWQKGVAAIEDMTDLPLALRERLADVAEIAPVLQTEKLVSRHGDSAKYLFTLTDGQVIESVLMKHNYGFSACVSTQAGCRMGCRFCASGLTGLVRNLSAGEIYGQVLGMEKDCGERVSRVVIMGCGEPLDNYDHTLAFIKNITAPYGLNLGGRHITLSTCGLVPQIRRLAMEKLTLTLAISLHGSNDPLRNRLMPINRKYPLGVLLEACRDYATQTKRRITFEYALIAGVNDTLPLAQELSKLISTIPCHVNLITINPVPELGIEPSNQKQVAKFQDMLERRGVAVTLRRSLGLDIAAACGQLRNKRSF